MIESKTAVVELEVEEVFFKHGVGACLFVGVTHVDASLVVYDYGIVALLSLGCNFVDIAVACDFDGVKYGYYALFLTVLVVSESGISGVVCSGRGRAVVGVFGVVLCGQFYGVGHVVVEVKCEKVSGAHGNGTCL